MERMPPPAVSPSPPRPLSPSSRPRRVAIIGGGITGLAAAHRVTELDAAAQVTLLESSDSLGGVLRTVRQGEWLIERSADMFTTREPWALDLCRRIGIADELIETDARYRRAFVVHGGRLVPVPAGFTLMTPAKVWPMLTTPLLSPVGKLRMAGEYFTPPRRDETDESLESFAVRRFGREAFERLIQPLIGGIYTADPAKLSMAATLPQFVEMERRYGSLIRGMRVQGPATPVAGNLSGFRVQEASGRRQPPNGDEVATTSGAGARYGLFVAPRNGMQQLVNAIAARLPVGCVRLNAAVDNIASLAAYVLPAGAWCLRVRGESNPQYFDDLILAAPGAVSSRLLRMVDGELSSLIGRVPHAGCSVVILGARRDQITHSLGGFG